MNRIIILGSGGSMPTVKRNLPCTALLHKGVLMLFDCGEGTQRQMMKFKVHYGRVKHIFISHMHLDHFLGLFGMVQTLELNERKTELNVYVPINSARKLKSMMKLPKFVSVKEYDTGEVLKTNEFTVTAFPLEHKLKKTFGFVFQAKYNKKFNEKKAKSLGVKGRLFKELETKDKIKINGKTIKFNDVGWTQKGFKLVYASDTIPLAATVKMSKNADYLIHDSAFSEQDKEFARETGHSTATQCAEIAKKAKVKNLILFHISSRYKNAEILKKEAEKIFKNVTLPDDGYSVNYI